MKIQIEFDVPDNAVFFSATLDSMFKKNGKWDYETQTKYTSDIKVINASTNEK